MQNKETNDLLDKAFDIVETGNLPGAMVLFEQVCQQDPENPEAWMMSGSIEVELGNMESASERLARAIELDPKLPEPYYYLARLYRVKNDPVRAVANVEEAVRLDPEYGEAYLLGGALYAASGEYEQAINYCRKAVELQPGSVEANSNLGGVLLQLGRAREALEFYVNITGLQPESSNSWIMLGRTYAQLDQLDNSVQAYNKALLYKSDAEEALYGLGYAEFIKGNFVAAEQKFRQALTINPAYTDAANSLGTVYQSLGEFYKAIDTFQQMLDANPDSVEGLFGKARALLELADHAGYTEAIQLLKRAVEIRPDFLEALLNLAAAQLSFDMPDKAMDCCKQALDMHPDSLEANALAARIELQSGRAEEAYQRIQPSAILDSRNPGLMITYGEICQSLQRSEEAIPVLEQLTKEPLSSVNRRRLHFRLGSLYDKVLNYPKAFKHYSTGNDLRAVEFNPLVNQEQVDTIIRTFSGGFLQKAPRASNQSDRPVFILGMPRSGTSLVEQILACHSGVFAAGELTDLYNLAAKIPAMTPSGSGFPGSVQELSEGNLSDLATIYLSRLSELSAEAVRVTDKMPGNFTLIGLIELLFPGARIIHCTRNAVDTCLSCYFQDFAMSQAYSYNLTHIASFYRDYQRLMAHWDQVISIPMLDVNYESLISTPEEVIRQIVEFCQLDWDEKCLQPHQATRFVATSSYDQVTRPIYSSSVGRWRHYEQYIEPLLILKK